MFRKFEVDPKINDSRMQFENDLQRSAIGVRFYEKSDTEIKADMRITRACDLGLMTGSWSGAGLGRKGAHTRDGDYNASLMTVRKGQLQVTYGSETISVAAGEAVLLSHETSGIVGMDPGAELFCAIVPPSMLSRHLQSHGPHGFGKIGIAPAMVHLFARYAAGAFDEDCMSDESARQVLSQDVANLAGSMINGWTNQLNGKDPSFDTAPKLEIMLRYIRTKADDPATNVDAIAASSGVSRRTANLIFARNGKTIQEVLLTHRLDIAHRRILSAPSGQTVADLAYLSGFGDLSTFYRQYKKRFGHTPGSRGQRH